MWFHTSFGIICSGSVKNAIGTSLDDFYFFLFTHLKKDFINLYLRERERVHKQGGGAAGEVQAGSLLNRKTMGLDPGTLGS